MNIRLRNYISTTKTMAASLHTTDAVIRRTWWCVLSKLWYKPPTIYLYALVWTMAIYMFVIHGCDRIRYEQRLCSSVGGGSVLFHMESTHYVKWQAESLFPCIVRPARVLERALSILMESGTRNGPNIEIKIAVVLWICLSGVEIKAATGDWNCFLIFGRKFTSGITILARYF